MAVVVKPWCFMMTKARKITVAIVALDKQQASEVAAKTYRSNNLELIFQCQDISAVESYLMQHRAPEVLIMCNQLSTRVLDSVKLIKQDSPKTEVLMLCGHISTQVLIKALDAGINGFVLAHHCNMVLEQSIIELIHGGSPLSPKIARQLVGQLQLNHKPQCSPELTHREQQVVNALIGGLSYKQVAAKLNIALETVRHHVKNIYGKYDVHSKSQLIASVVQPPALKR